MSEPEQFEKDPREIRPGADSGQRRYLDNRAHRGNANFTRGEYAWRVGWGLVAPLWRLVPRPFYGLRNAVLRAFGARIGRDRSLDRPPREVGPTAQSCAARTITIT